MEELKQQLLAYHCPRWDELPDLELYVDQVVSYVERHTGILDINREGNLITSSMINNYVKMKLIPPPVKRKYNRRHLARLIVICTLKRDFSISELYEMTEITLMRYDSHEAFDFFAEELERSLARVFHQKVAPLEMEITQAPPAFPKLWIRAVSPGCSTRFSIRYRLRLSGSSLR